MIAGKKDELVGGGAVGKIPRLALGQVHLEFAGEQVGGQLADEQHDDAGVRELDADFFGRELKPADVGADEVDQQQRAEQIAAGEQQRNLMAEKTRSHHQPSLEVMGLRAVQPLIRLGDGADEHEDDSERQQHDHEPQR